MKDVISATGSLSDKRADLRVLIPAMVAWAVGLWALAWSPAARMVLGIGAVVAGLWMARRWTLTALTVAVTGLILLTSAGQAWRQSAGPVEDLATAGASAHVRGSVLAEPIVVDALGERPLVLVRLRITQIDARGYRTAVSTPVLVRGDERWRGLQWREEVSFSARLREARPGSPERAVLVPLESPHVSVRESALLAASDHARDRLRTAVDPLPRDARGLVPALVVGDTSLTPPDLSEAMRATGMAHLSAVSGSNLAICLAAVMAVVVLTPIHRRWRVLIGLAVIAVFIVIARPEPSVLRAALMGAVGVLAFSRARSAAGLPALAATVITLLAIDPWLARSYGFVLSTLATLGLILFARPWGRAILRGIHRVVPARARLPPWVGDALAIPVAAHVMTAPVVVLLQGHVSLIAVIANLLAAPLVAPATLAGAATTIVASFSPTLGGWLAWTSAPPAWLIAQIGRRGAQVPGATIPWPEGAPGALLLAGILLSALLAGPWLGWVIRSWPTWVGSGTAVLLVTTWPVGSVAWPPPDWELVVCDVGQGDGIVLGTEEQAAVVVDVGPDLAAMPACLRRLGIRELDAVILTHFDSDHISGLEPVLAGWPVAEIFVSPVPEPDHGAAQVDRLAGEHGIPVRELRAGDQLAWGNVRAEVWWPARTLHSGSEANNASVVLAVELGPPPTDGEPDRRVRALLLGDIEREAGQAIHAQLRRTAHWQAFASRIDLVKTPHHGSANLHEPFLQAVPGALAAISVGENDFGHPTESHLRLYRELGSVIGRTDQRGDIALLARSDDGDVRWQAQR